MFRTRSLIVFLTIVVLCAPLGCEIMIGSVLPAGSPNVDAASLPDGIDSRNPNVERSSALIDFGTIETLRIDIPTGRVTVREASDMESASLKVTETLLLKGYSRDDMANLLRQCKVTAEPSFVDATRLEVEAEIARDIRNEDIAFDVLLVLPRGVPMQVILETGPVVIENIEGNVEIQTHAGEVTVKGVKGHVVVRTTERPITVNDVAGNVQATTSVADITIRAAPAPDGFISANTTEGAINLGIPTTTNAALRLEATHGTVTANLAGFKLTDLTTGGDFLRGVLNDGGGHVEARTTEGDIAFVGI